MGIVNTLMALFPGPVVIERAAKGVSPCDFWLYAAIIPLRKVTSFC
jgi:hypothetical protein